ncbi:hypothetical protein TNCV_4417321 [Trichonephila clavipes]|nr:hypothetical protein TNCV_4417321 [Trichonephila clavipes]
MLIYEPPSSSLRCRANPNLFRGVLNRLTRCSIIEWCWNPHTAYPIPAGTRYTCWTVQKTMFGLQATPSDPGSCTGRDTHKRPLEQQPKPLSKKKRVIITPIIRPSVPSVRDYQTLPRPCPPPQPVSIQDPSPEQTTSQILLPDPPVVETTSQIHLPDPPEQTTSQILLPDPPEQTTSEIHFARSTRIDNISDSFYQIHHLIRQHLRFIYQNHHLIRQHLRFILPEPNVVEALEPTLTDDSSIDQIMSSVFGDYLPQAGFPRRISKILRCWTRCLPCLMRIMISSRFWIILKQGWPCEQQETPMDLTMPRMKKVINTTGF